MPVACSSVMQSTETDRLIPPCCRPGRNKEEFITFKREESQIEPKQEGINPEGINLSVSVDTIRNRRPPPFGHPVPQHRLPCLLQPMGRAGSRALWCVAPAYGASSAIGSAGTGYYAAIGPGLGREQSKYNAFRPVLHYRGAKVRIFKNRMRVPLKAGYL